MKLIHNKITKSAENITRINYEHELTTLEKYVETTAELSTVENKQELFFSWLIYSLSFLGGLSIFGIFFSFIDGNEYVSLESTLLVYISLCIFAYTSKDFLYLLLVLNIMKSNLNMRVKLSNIQEHNLVSGNYLYLAKGLIIILSILLLFSFAAYFTNYLKHPLLTSLLIYFLLLTTVNVVRKKLHIAVHISFFIFTLLLCLVNLFVLADNRYEERLNSYDEPLYTDEEIELEKEADVHEIIDDFMSKLIINELTKDKEETQSLINETRNK